jgi:hypothetical protein
MAKKKSVPKKSCKKSCSKKSCETKKQAQKKCGGTSPELQSEVIETKPQTKPQTKANYFLGLMKKAFGYE